MIRWLHISDLHLGSNDLSTDRLRDELLTFLRKEGLRCDYVFCTGDIKTAGPGDGGFTDQMALYLHQVCEAVGVSVERLFIVPGNHDIKRDIPERVEAIKRVMFQRRGIYDPAKGVIGHDDMVAIMKGEEDFVDFLSKIYPADRVAMYGNPDRPHFNIEMPDFNVLHVDTTVTYTEGQEATDLIVGGYALYQEVQGLNKSKPTILLTHYPFTSLLQDERKQVGIMLQRSGIKLWLAGHEHDHLLQPIHYLDSLQPGELRYEDRANASFIIGEYNPATGRGQARAYAWFPEGWAQYPYVDLNSRHVDRYDFTLRPMANGGRPRETTAARKVNEAFYHRLPATVEQSLLPTIQDDGVPSTLDELLGETWQSETPHVIMLGDGGMGKTTMLLDYCRRSSTPVLYISAETLAPTGVGIEQYCINSVYDGDADLFQESLHTRYNEPTLTLFIDGLNEVDAKAEKEFITELQRLNILFKGLRIVVTSRSNFTARYKMPGYRQTVLCPLDDSQIRTYFSPEEWGRIERAVSLHRLLKNPMMVTVYKQICSVIDEFKDVEFLDWILPVKNATDLFHDYYVAQLALMLKRGIRDGKKLQLADIVIHEILPGIAYAYECAHRLNLGAASFRSLLAELLENLTVNEKRLMPIQEYAREPSLPEVGNFAVRDLLTTELRLLYSDNAMVAFPHQMYRDYLSARWIVKESCSQEKIMSLWNSRNIPLPVMMHIRQGSGAYWQKGIANRIRCVGANGGVGDTGLLVDNLLNCFPGSTECGVPDYAGLQLRGHQLPDNSLNTGRISLDGAEIDEATVGLSAGDLTLYTNLCLSEDGQFLAALAQEDRRQGTEIRIYSVEDGSLAFYYTLNKKVGKMEFHGNRLFVLSGNLLVFSCIEGEWHYNGEMGEPNRNITQGLKRIIQTDEALFIYYKNRLVTYSLTDCRRTEVVDGKLWEHPVAGKDITSLRRTAPWVGNPRMRQMDILSETGNEALRARSYGDGRLMVESGNEVLTVLSKGMTLLLDATISADGKRAATLGFHVHDGKRKVQLWDLDRQRRIDNLTCPSEVRNIHLSETGRWIMGETRDGTWVLDCGNHQENVFSEHFVSNHAGHLVTYGDKVIRKKGRTLFFYDLQSGTEEPLESPAPNPRLVCFLPNGSLAAVDETGRSLCMRSTRSNNYLSYYMDGADIWSIQAVNGKPFIAVFTSDKFIRIYHTGVKQCLIKQAGSSTANRLVAHPSRPLLADTDGRRYLETRSFDDEIKWGKEIGHWHPHPYRHEYPPIDGDILDVAFNEQNQLLVIILANGKIVFCTDRTCEYNDSFKIITAFNVDAYDFSNSICSDELKRELCRNGADFAVAQ